MNTRRSRNSRRIPACNFASTPSCPAINRFAWSSRRRLENLPAPVGEVREGEPAVPHDGVPAGAAQAFTQGAVRGNAFDCLLDLDGASEGHHETGLTVLDHIQRTF